MSTLKRLSKQPGYAWIVLFVVFLASTAAPLNQFKVPPMMSTLMESFQLDLSMAGLLMSIFAVTGFILALPGGFILQRLGPKTTGLIATGCTVIGASLGALSPSIGLLFVSRVIEGIGMGLIAVVAPAVVGMWFPAERRGTPMGIWAIWVPVGRTVMYNVAPVLGTSFSWQAVWWFGAEFSLVAFVLYWVLFQKPPVETEALTRQTANTLPPREEPGFGRSLANRNIWLLSFAFLCYSIAFLSFNTFLPTFLVSMRGNTLVSAGFITSLTGVTMLSCPLAGWISDRVNSRKLVYTIPFLIFAVMWLFPFGLTGWLIPAYAVGLGIIAGPIPTAIFAAVPEVMESPHMVGIGMAVIALGQNLGMFIGPVLFGKLVEMIGWTSAGFILIPICLLGVVAGWLVKVR